MKDFIEKGVENSPTNVYRMREAVSAKGFLKIEENVITCLGKSVA